MKQINIRISEERYEAFKEYCFREKTSMTSFLLSSIEKVLEPAKISDGAEDKKIPVNKKEIKYEPDADEAPYTEKKCRGIITSDGKKIELGEILFDLELTETKLNQFITDGLSPFDVFKKRDMKMDYEARWLT